MSRLTKNAAITALVISTIGAFEGIRTTAYKDPVGIPTVCFGETKGVKLGQKYSLAECDAMLVASVKEHEAGMVKCLKNPSFIPDKTYGAFLSFTYNVGVGNFCSSTLAKKANSGDLTGACNELPKWNKAKGITLAGLTNRRQEERKLCLEGLK